METGYYAAPPETADIETCSDEYASRFAGEVGKWFLEIQKRATLNMLSPYKNASILDVGGGHDQTADAIVKHGYNLHILDSNKICYSRVNHLLRENLCTFSAGEILNLPFQSESVDVVISYRLLPHTTHWRRYLEELARVAGKAVIIDYPDVRSVNSMARLLFFIKKKIEGNTRPFKTFRLSEIEEVFEQMGFTTGGIYKQYFFPMAIHRKLKSQKFSRTVERVFRAAGFTRIFGSPVIVKMVKE